MGEEDDVAQALAFLRKHDASHTGAPAMPAIDLAALDQDEGEGLLQLGKPSRHEPVGPNWKKPGAFVHLPKILGEPPDSWLIHERQESTGKYKAWLFFSTMSGKYYCLNESGVGFTPMAMPHNPWVVPIGVRVGSASILAGASAKLDTAVLLPDLHKTGFLLKQPLEFLDKPASLFVLCAGLRNTGAAAEFCAKRFHTNLLPKLSSRATVWYDYELVEIVSQATQALEGLLLEAPNCFAGSSLAVALLIGSRLVVGALGGVRCLLCRARTMVPAPRGRTLLSGTPTPPTPWSVRLVGGGDAHTARNPEERLRVESEGGRFLGSQSDELFGGSARSAGLAAIPEEWDREVVRLSRATNSFAALGLVPSDLQEGAAAIRRVFRRRSLIVHPDKAGDQRRAVASSIFSQLEAAAARVEAMLQEDADAAFLLAQIHHAHDEERLAVDPAAAAKLLGVPENCSATKAAEASKKKFDASLGRLQGVARQDVQRAVKILEIARESVARGTQLWTPVEADAGVRVTRALGCKDLKLPTPLLRTGLATEVVQLGMSEASGLVLLTDGAEPLAEATVGTCLAEHSPNRPRAAALRLALQGKPAQGGRGAVSVVCAFFNGELRDDGPPPEKRPRSGRPERVRVSHVLLRWADLRTEDEFLRPGMPPAMRTQAEAERELLELTEALLRAGDPKGLGARFKAEVLKRSECSSALNVPYADLGWVEPGGAELPLEMAAFDTPVGGLSDVVVTSRGAHLMYRLA